MVSARRGLDDGVAERCRVMERCPSGTQTAETLDGATSLGSRERISVVEPGQQFFGQHLEERRIAEQLFVAAVS